MTQKNSFPFVFLDRGKEGNAGTAEGYNSGLLKLEIKI